MIDIKTLKAIAHIRGLHAGRVLYRLHRYYCGPMKTRGKCDLNCRVTCNDNLNRIFRPFAYTKDREAIAVWRMRDAVASTMEEDKEAVPEENVWGEPKFDNVFSFLAEEYDEGKT